jgi:hypothetical protein
MMAEKTADGVPISHEQRMFACADPACKLLHISFHDKNGKAICVASMDSGMLMQLKSIHREIVRDKAEG